MLALIDVFDPATQHDVLITCGRIVTSKVPADQFDSICQTVPTLCDVVQRKDAKLTPAALQVMKQLVDCYEPTYVVWVGFAALHMVFVCRESLLIL